jgi:NADPH:quinone reductase-like Zn-dependent oxidoreductase
MLRAAYGLRRPRNPVRGTDVAGTVKAVGPGVTGLSEGEAVFGCCVGAFAEQATARADDVAVKPERISFEGAAGVPMSGLVALQHPASRAGRSIGADHVIDHTREDFTRSGHRYDVILDLADNRSLAARLQALNLHGTLIPNSGSGNRWVGSLGRIVLPRMASLAVRESFRPFLSTLKRDDLLTLRGMLADGSLRPVVGETQPLDEAAAAVPVAGGGHATWKVVIVTGTARTTGTQEESWRA